MEKSLDKGNFCGRVLKRQQAGDFLFTETCYQPGTELLAHSHDRWYLCFIRQGFYWETVDRTTRLIQPRTVAFHPKGELHSERFHGTVARSFNIEGPGDPGQPKLEHGGVPAHLSHMLYNAFLDEDGLSMECLAHELLHLLQGQPWCLHREPDWLQAARESLTDMVQQPVSLRQLAAGLGVTPAHLATAFRRVHRCTPGEYLRHLRIDAACRQLATEVPIADVALASGFYDQSHFTRTFRRVLGVTPAAYRALM